MGNAQGRSRILILGGFGRVGHAAVRYLLNRSDADLIVASRRVQVVPTDIEPSFARRVTTRVVDIHDDEALCQACGDADLVISCAGPAGEIGDRVARACRRRAVPLLDAGGYDPLLYQLELAEQQEHSSVVPLVINVGLLPGLSGIFPAWLLQARGHDDKVEELLVHYAGRDAWSYNSAWDIVHSLGGYGTDHGFSRLKEGVLVREPFRRAGSRVMFPEPVGKASMMLIHSEEILRLARQYGIDNVRVYGANIGPRAAMVCMLARTLGWYRQPRSIGRGARWLVGASKRDMHRLTPLYAIHVDIMTRRGDWESASLILEDTYRATGAVLGIAARLILEGYGPEPGVFMLHEAFPADRVIALLQEAGLIQVHGQVPEHAVVGQEVPA